MQHKYSRKNKYINKQKRQGTRGTDVYPNNFINFKYWEIYCSNDIEVQWPITFIHFLDYIKYIYIGYTVCRES